VLTDANKPFMLSTVMLNVVMLTVLMLNVVTLILILFYTWPRGAISLYQKAPRTHTLAYLESMGNRTKMCPCLVSKDCSFARSWVRIPQEETIFKIFDLNLFLAIF
jgi:hypothetical protein